MLVFAGCIFFVCWSLNTEGYIFPIHNATVLVLIADSQNWTRDEATHQLQK